MLNIGKFLNKVFPNLVARLKMLKQLYFFSKNGFKKKTPKIIYTLTPPSRLMNIGDHAQVVAIYKWLKKNYPDTPVIEFNKDDCIKNISLIKAITGLNDIIFIHSGGNLGDRGIWSETGRRNIIQAFPNNKIISLPQTIFFSDTEKGAREKEITKRIYNQHKNLIIMGRDFESTKLAAEMFLNAKTFPIPDFVLSLNRNDYIQQKEVSKKVLFCLRNDNESIFSDDEKYKLPKLLSLPDNDLEFYDTTIDQAIKNADREKLVKDTLAYFSDFEMIITDRFHGVIFATILNKPVIVLPTIDHKLTSAVRWFENMPQIRFLNKEDITSIQNVYTELLTINPIEKDWNKLYFNELKQYI